MASKPHPRTVNVHQAKTQLSRLLARVERGEEIVIAKAGRPVARLLPFEPRDQARVLGGARGQIVIADDFDAPLPDDILAGFEGRETPR
jgi:prevent-host-death family protein